MKMKLCCEPGCNRMVVDLSHNYCPFHLEQRQKRKVFTQRGKSGEYNSLYHTSRWRKERKQFLAEHPQCVMCGAKADTVDHIRAHKGNEAIFWCQANWQPLCHSCHSRKTLRENNNFNANR